MLPEFLRSAGWGRLRGVGPGLPAGMGVRGGWSRRACRRPGGDRGAMGMVSTREEPCDGVCA
jgi:hypothetical protein